MSTGPESDLERTRTWRLGDKRKGTEKTTLIRSEDLVSSHSSLHLV